MKIPDITENGYKSLTQFFNKYSGLKLALKILGRLLPLIVFVSYPAVLAALAINREYISLAKVCIIPAAGFAFVTALRKKLNFKRPYEKYDFVPVTPRNKKGESFPSRHCASAFLISTAVASVDLRLGAFLLSVSVVIGAVRVLSGVHFVRDVLAGGLLGIAIGALAFL